MKILPLFLLLLSSQLLASVKDIDVIYGEDNRVDVFESRNSALVELSRSSAAMISSKNLKLANGQIEITSKSLEKVGICAQERFSQQSAAADCSGFLITENLLVTAGHCIKTQSDCSSYKWVFDYKVDYSTQSMVTVSSDNVYSCKRIVERALETLSKDDFALIELDRRVSDRRPLSFRRSGSVSVGSPLVVIGHPSGLPTKIADGAQVRSLAAKYFVANLDTYGGNSGSAVINTRTGEVEGILVRGENDYVYDSNLRCQVSNRCGNDECRGEDVTFISNIKSLAKIK